MSTANELELGMLALLNDERAAAGLEPLRLITLLNDAAETHSQWMLNTNQFSHRGEDGSSPTDRMQDAGYPFEGNSLALENIGWQSSRGEEGFVDDVAQVHASLMDSPGHRANILNPNAEDVGIGVEVGTFSSANGDFEAVMVTQVFGSTDADISAWVDPESAEDDMDVIDDLIVENDDETPLTPEAEDEPETDATDDVDDAPVVAEDDTNPDVDDVPESDAPEDDTPDAEPEAPVEDPMVAEDDTPAEDMPLEDMPLEDAPADDEPMDMPDVIALEDVPQCGLTSLTVDLTDVFEINRDGEQITLETTEDKLITAFMNAFDDWAFLNEPPAEDDTMDIADLMIDGPDEDGLACEYLEDDADEIATMCL